MNVAIPLKKWQELNAELEQLRESEMRCREALESAEHTARKQNERIKDKEIARLRQQIAEFAQERGNFTRTFFELRGIIEEAEAQTHEIGSLRDHSYKQADRIKELKEQIEAYRNYGSIKRKKVTRLREALKTVRRKVEHPRVYADVIDIIDDALAGAKGAESEAEPTDDAILQHTEGQCSVDGPMERDQRVSPEDETDSHTEQSPKQEGSLLSAGTTDVQGSATTPLKPLRLLHYMDELSGGKTWTHADFQQEENAERIELYLAEIVAAIGHLDFVQHEQGCAMVESVDRADKAAKELAIWLLRKDEVDRDVRRQIDSLWERTDIYVDLQEKQREQIDKLNSTANRALGKAEAAAEGIADVRRQIDALEKRIDFHAVNNPLNGNPDDISLHELISVVDQRCALIEQVLGGMTEEATFEKIDKLTEAVLMSLDHHKAVERGMKMWGSGDFERMANKLREGKEKGENNARL